MQKTGSNVELIKNINSLSSDAGLDKPTIFEISSEKEAAKVTKFFNKDVKIRISRFCFMAFAPIIFLIAVTYEHDNFHLSSMVGIGVLIMYISYFSMIGYLFYSGSRKSKNRALFRIWTRSEAGY